MLQGYFCLGLRPSTWEFTINNYARLQRKKPLLPSKLLPNVEPSYLYDVIVPKVRCQQPPGLRHGSAAARLLRLWVRIPAWMYVCSECCGSSLRRADNSSRGVLPLWCGQRVWSRRSVRGGHEPESSRSATRKKKNLRNKTARKEVITNFKQQSVRTTLEKSPWHSSSEADYAEIVHISYFQ